MVQRQITLVRPVMNGIRDEVPRNLNRAGRSSHVECYDTPRVIMWKRLGHAGRSDNSTTVYLSCGQR